ncbi:hypothetical protein HWV62_10779 [Athelia sp. TMB]|nr:hypothetical protein HWV62_10779 [Athelia sp. TMB]
MHPSIRVLNAGAHPEQHAHPAAPEELKKAFGDFLKKFEASGSGAKDASTSSKKSESGKEVFGEFWEAPSRFWRPKVRELEEAEMDAISSGGASLH